jgi:hypothetical protein
MNVLVEEIKRFLESADFETRSLDQPPVILTAQNQDLIVFVAEANGNLSSAVQSTLNRLVKPFTAKTFGPKTIELYAVFVCTPEVSIAEIEKCEQNTTVCRKIVLRDADDIESRLSFLKPLDVLFTTPEVDQLFWSKLSTDLSENDLRLLNELKEHDVSFEDFLEHFLQ